MSRVEAHESECPLCRCGLKDRCPERDEAVLLDDLQAAVALWPKLPSHGPFCACLEWRPSSEWIACDCDHAARNEARAKAFQLLGMDP